MSVAQIANCKLQIANCKLVAGGLRWEVAGEYRELLLGPEGLRLEEWLQAGQAKVVKHGPHRTVYRVTLPELSFYVKHCRLTGIRAWARELVRPPKARIEYEKALVVAKRGVPTITPLAVGHRSFTAGPRDSFLVTRALEDTESLNSFLENRLSAFEPGRQARVRQRLAIMLGGFVARMHDAGIRHDDLHPGNLLVHLDAGDRPSLYLIDLHAVRLGLPLQWRASRENLIIFNRWFVLRASRTDRLRFWRAYCGERRGESGERSSTALRALRSALSVDLERRTWQSNLRFWRRRDRRCLGTIRYYY
ncbi:MAG TPA: lipopolysaccharide kinase InaA family protein, partial [Gemmataceae bacterium]|nr:lipopolysaccharide kinase InaA family protein [Gemmataceae bacterium]